MKTCYWNHEWLKWKETRRGQTLDFTFAKEGRITGAFIEQEKECLKCGIKKIKIEKYSI